MQAFGLNTASCEIVEFGEARRAIRQRTSAKLDDLARCGIQSEGLHHAGAKPLVLNGVLHVHLEMAHQSQRQLENVRGPASTERSTPFPAMEQQSGLLLRSREGDPESSASGCPRMRPPDKLAAITCSTSASVSGSASMRSNPAGVSPSGSNWAAPTQSRPIAVSRSNASVDAVANRERMRERIASLSGRRLSK